MEVLKYLLLMVGGTVACASVVPVCQYLYARFVNKETYNIRYYFSQNLFDVHINQYDVPMCCVINNREELAEMWKKEMRYELP